MRSSFHLYLKGTRVGLRKRLRMQIRRESAKAFLAACDHVSGLCKKHRVFVTGNRAFFEMLQKDGLKDVLDEELNRRGAVVLSATYAQPSTCVSCDVRFVSLLCIPYHKGNHYDETGNTSEMINFPTGSLIVLRSRLRQG